ncbi:glycosyltransferase [Synechococcus sp. CS-197]|uniref:glycosyltransferase n=1 Tax=Synechococcus sp. CS-197 TaxID=2847985 RepID=UPI0001525C6C|nr:glycosyltransferase [Synechococcus sp. CS-197]MCT0250841.1 glycosyltransferase [Synechococcus sp. CS-197]CAK22547.1 Glycosyltransferase of family GT4 [Synechococcus sp. WH 7803]
MRILFSHNNYPAQFRRLIPALIEQGHEVVFLCRSKEWHAPELDGVRLLPFEPHRAGGGAAIHPYLRRFEAAVLQGQATYRSLQPLVQEGWAPEWIINHVGFGNGLYLSDVFPNARRIGLFEWYYNACGADVDFLKRGPVDPDRALRLRTWNAHLLLELAACDFAVTPTRWQRDQFPKHLRSHLRVIHEGIDVDGMQALRQSPPIRPACLPADPDLEIVTYVSRGFEEYRGFPQAMQAIAELQRRRPGLHALIVGHDGVAYGAKRQDGRGWGEWARDELTLDPSRTHWMGMLQDAEYHQVLAHSSVHLYLTVPFVLSWSLLEAMAAGCALVSSATPPVLEVLEHDRSALLVDFFDPMAQANAVERLLDQPDLRARLSRAASKKACDFKASIGIQSWLALFGEELRT